MMNRDGETHQIGDSVECREYHGFVVGHFLLELDDRGVDKVKEQARNDGVPALHSSDLRTQTGREKRGSHPDIALRECLEDKAGHDTLMKWRTRSRDENVWCVNLRTKLLKPP
jgi:hypothetical protein